MWRMIEIYRLLYISNIMILKILVVINSVYQDENMVYQDANFWTFSWAIRTEIYVYIIYLFLPTIHRIVLYNGLIFGIYHLVQNLNPLKSNSQFIFICKIKVFQATLS